MAVQTSVSAQPGTAAPGNVVRALKTPVHVSRIAGVAIPFGAFVVRNATDRSVKLPVSASEVQSGLVGVASADYTKPYLAAGFAVGDDLSVMLEGAVYVITEEAVTQGQPVYVRHTSDGGSNTALGTARNDADTNRCARLSGCVFAETTTAAGFALVLKTSAVASNFGYVVLKASLADVSAPSSVYLPVPVNGTVERIVSVLGGAITVADSAVTSSISALGVGAFATITNGGFTVAFTGSGAGVTDSATPTALNTVAVGDSIRITTDGASTTTATLDVEVLIKVTEP